MIHPLMIIADDLTGANDAGVAFAEVGYRTVLKLQSNKLEFNPEVDVYSISLNTRAMAKTALPTTAHFIESLLNSPISQLFIKVDSTLRGSIAYQIQGALKAWQKKYPDAIAIICPAYPQMGRTIKNGVLYVDGISVEQTASGQDRICPVRTPVMSHLIPSAISLKKANLTKIKELITQQQCNQFILDATTQADLTQIAQLILSLGQSVIAVGSAGLAKAMAQLRHFPQSRVQNSFSSQRTLMIVTSIHDSSQKQVDTYLGSPQGANSIVFNPHPVQLLNPAAYQSLTQQLTSLVASGNGHVIIRANPVKLFDSNIKAMAQRIATLFAQLGRFCLEHYAFDQVILVGGDGAVALLNAMQISEVQILSSIAEGVPLGKTSKPKLNLITKSGGFGSPDLLCHIMNKLEH